MAKNKYLRTGLAALAATSALAVSSAASAALIPFSDDFESYTATSTFAPDWVAFSDNGGFPGGYFIATPSTNGPQISSLEDDGVSNQYLNFYANYDNRNVHDRVNCNPCSPNEQEGISFFKEYDFTGADTAGGITWVFDFLYAQNPDSPVTGDTQVSAFIRVFDPSFNLLDEQNFDTIAATDAFQAGQLQVTLNPLWTEGKIQIGFFNLTGMDNGSGRFYDDVNFAAVPVPAAVWLFGSALGLLAAVRRRMA